jgi:hypothetical protein
MKRHIRSDDTLDDHLTEIEWLQAQKDHLQPRPGFIAASRRRLIEHIQVESRATASPSLWQRLLGKPSPRRRLREAFSLVLLAACLVFLGSNILLASQIALPGEVFYPVKLATEQFQLAVTPSREGDAHLYIKFSQERTTEIIDLILEEDYDHVPPTVTLLDKQIDRTLASLDAMASQDASQAQVLATAFEKTLRDERVILTILADTYPPSARPVIDLALQANAAGLAALHE